MVVSPLTVSASGAFDAFRACGSASRSISVFVSALVGFELKSDEINCAFGAWPPTGGCADLLVKYALAFPLLDPLVEALASAPTSTLLNPSSVDAAAAAAAAFSVRARFAGRGSG